MSSSPSRFINQASRITYGLALLELAAIDDRIVALSADLASSTGLLAFQEKYPDRFFNVGVAEQNLFGIAAGLAKSGKIPFIATFATFASLRAAEQARTDIAYGDVPVRICGTHYGFGLAPAGPTHHALEDIAVYRSMSNITIVAPADGVQAAMATQAIAYHGGPVYLRLSRPTEPTVYRHDEPFTIGEADTLIDGEDITLIACGGCVGYALHASELMNKHGIRAAVMNMSTIKPLDKSAVLEAAGVTGAIMTVEEHNIYGGLGSAVAEVIAEAGIGIRFKRWGIQDVYTKTGEYPELLALYGLDATGIAKQAELLLTA